MVAPTYAVGTEGLLPCLFPTVPSLFPTLEFKTPPWALPLPGPAAPPLPCTLETRGTGEYHTVETSGKGERT